MYKGKGGQYVSAGVQTAPGMRMTVRSNVRLPDSEVGSSWYEAEKTPYYAKTVAVKPVGTKTVPLNAALVFLCALFVIFGILILNKAVQRAQLTKQITAMEAAIVTIQKDNLDLAAQLAEARDLARIGYDASQRLHMIAATEADTVAVLAPSTRPFGEETIALAENSPVLAQDGKVTGSR